MSELDIGKIVADFLKTNLSNILKWGKSVLSDVKNELDVRLQTAYKNYLEKSIKKHIESKSFFIRDKAVDLYQYYVPLVIKCKETVIENPGYENVTSFSKRIVISGTAGCGKSILMKHLFINSVVSKKQVPILLELRDLKEPSTIEDLLYSTSQDLGLKLERNFFDKGIQFGHFIFILDGYDEVDFSLRTKLLDNIKKLSNKATDCTIIISSRPDDVFDGISEFSKFVILPLTLESACHLVEKIPYDEEIKSNFLNDLKTQLFKKHTSFLSNPLLLSIMLLTYGEYAEIPTKLSIFYSQAYESLFQRHDALKSGYQRKRKSNLDIQDFARLFSVFCLQTYEKRQFKFSRIEALDAINKSFLHINLSGKNEDYLDDLLKSVCLLLEDGIEISFAHRSFQEYFVAVFIANTSPELQKKLLNRYWINIRHDNVIKLLLEINPNLVERELLIPQLENMFNSLGVKRNVGMTQYFKYLKKSFKSIIFESSSQYIGIIFRDLDVLHWPLVLLTINHCKSSEKNTNEEIDLNTKSLFKKYGKHNCTMEYDLDKCTYKSDIIADLATSSNSISKVFLQKAFEGMKILKKRNDNAEENLDNLLGI